MKNVDVIFQCTSLNQNRLTVPVEGHGKVYFLKGSYKTSDKDLIKKLWKHPVAKRNDYYMVTSEELVAKYLAGEIPDKITREMLDNLTLQGILELGEVMRTNATQPELIKVEVEGEYITNAVQQILDYYTKKKSKEEIKEELEEKEVTKIESDVKRSGDMKAKEAIEFIESSEAEELESFLSKDETRKTVIEAYQEKVNK